MTKHSWTGWEAYEHPELGPVELGGWDMFYLFRNPPQQFLQAELEPLAVAPLLARAIREAVSAKRREALIPVELRLSQDVWNRLSPSMRFEPFGGFDAFFE